MRIAGITIPDKKRLEVALTAIYGIGRSGAREVLTEAGIDFDMHADKLSGAQEAKIRELVEAHKIEGDLKREQAGNVKRLKDINAYRGMRHTRNLPSHGQRTKTNSRTVRGNVRKTMGSGRRKVEKK